MFPVPEQNHEWMTMTATTKCQNDVRGIERLLPPESAEPTRKWLYALSEWLGCQSLKLMGGRLYPCWLDFLLTESTAGMRWVPWIVVVNADACVRGIRFDRFRSWCALRLGAKW